VSFHELGLTQAVADLEALRERLSADRIVAEWKTASGVVSVMLPGPHFMVADEDVPMKVEPS
jgi:hypothetical protein